MAGRGTQWERKGEAGGGPASYRARPAAAGLVVVAREALVGGGAAAAAWLRGRWGVFGLMGRGLNPVKRSIVNGSVG